MTQQKKVIIIGSGLGGLSCGAILAKNGYDVTVLEQGVQVGGCLQCFSRRERSMLLPMAERLFSSR